MSRQYDTTGTILIDPDSVTITGPAASISEVNSVKTEMLQLNNLKGSIRQKIGLVKSHLVTTEVDEVTVLVPVEKFTEGSMEIPVHSINVQQVIR
jgi:hypothetical protein